MEEEATTAEPVCAKEALDLLNCVAASPFDGDACLRLLDALRTCVLHKDDTFDSSFIGNVPPMNSLGTSIKVKKFSLAEKSSAAEVPESKDKA